MEKKITIKKEEMEYINSLLGMTGKKIYDKYGLHRDESIIYTASFEDGIEVDIKVVICEEAETPYVEGILFKDGREITFTEPADSLEGEWNFEVDGEEYTVIVESTVDE